MSKKKIKSRVKLTFLGRLLHLSGWLIMFIGPVAAAVIGGIRVVNSPVAQVTYLGIIALVIVLIGAKGYSKRKLEGLRAEVANYKTEANLNDDGSEKLERSIHFYRQTSILLNIFDCMTYVLLVGLFAAVCYAVEFELAKLSNIIGICFLCALGGAVLSVIGRAMIRGDK